jgi:translation initiation factor IF-1
MSKESVMKLEGKVIEVLPNAIFRVELENGHVLLSYLAGKMRQYDIKITMGDAVEVEVTPYDLSRGRIVRRK